MMRKTKIICTLGPAVDSQEKLEELIKAGMNVARLNFSHGDYEEQGNRIELFKKTREKVGSPVAVYAASRRAWLACTYFNINSFHRV